MNQEPLTPPEITTEEWERTPPSVKRLFEYLEKRISILEEENKYLREQLGRNSNNSSQPPSSDEPNKRVERKKESTGKKRGGQPGHEGHSRELVLVEECRRVFNHQPKACRKCGSELKGEDPEPCRHQVVEIPPIKPEVEEHRLHQLKCEQCGTLTRAKLPEGVPLTGYGVRVVAIAAVLSGLYRNSERMVQLGMKDLFGVEMALGTVNGLRTEASQAIAEPVSEAYDYVKEQPVIHSDETGFVQGNADGKNPEKRKAWLWVAVTTYVTVFRVALSRGQDAARALLGETFRAILITDRWNAYNWVSLILRQLCWAHLKRDCAPRNAVLNTPCNGEKFGGILLGHPPYLNAKAGGDKSMAEKRGTLEGAYNVVLQDPCDKVKAILPEPQLPVAQLYAHCYSV